MSHASENTRNRHHTSGNTNTRLSQAIDELLRQSAHRHAISAKRIMTKESARMISWDGGAYEEESSEAGCCAQHVTSENREVIQIQAYNPQLPTHKKSAYSLYHQFPAPYLSPNVCGCGDADA